MDEKKNEAPNYCRRCRRFDDEHTVECLQLSVMERLAETTERLLAAVERMTSSIVTPAESVAGTPAQLPASVRPVNVTPIRPVVVEPYAFPLPIPDHDYVKGEVVRVVCNVDRVFRPRRLLPGYVDQETTMLVGTVNPEHWLVRDMRVGVESLFTILRSPVPGAIAARVLISCTLDAPPAFPGMSISLDLECIEAHRAVHERFYIHGETSR